MCIRNVLTINTKIYSVKDLLYSVSYNLIQICFVFVNCLQEIMERGLSEEENLETIFSVIEIATSMLGLAIFLANFSLTVFICKLLVLNNAAKNKQGILIHTAFVSINDTLCGFCLIVLGFIQVKSQLTVYLCVYVIVACITLQVVSEGNITCVCIMRYISVRNIRMRSGKIQTYFTRVLIVFNIAIGLLSMISFVSLATARNISDATSKLCSLTSTTEEESVFTFSAYLGLGIIFTLTADIVSFMTIKKLKTEVNNAIQPWSSNTNYNSGTASQQDETVRKSTKLRQQKATITICLILLFINLSFVPRLSLYVLVYMGIHLDHVDRRVLFLAFLLNSLVNPIIIATRVEEIRSSVRYAFRNLSSKLTALFSTT